ATTPSSTTAVASWWKMIARPSRSSACGWTTPGNGGQQMVHAPGAVPVRVLIVEDNRDICGNIAAYLGKHGYVLDFAYDGVSGLRLAATNPFDVIVLDLMLPRMDGLRVCETLRAEARVDTPVLMLTAR